MNGGICLSNGTCQNQINWLSPSEILSSTEKNNLYAMIPSFTTGVLIYRATRDEFTAKSFHDRCDNIPNTVTVIRNNLNFIFGGFTSARWNSIDGGIADPNAFIFSLRRNGASSNYKLMIQPDHSDYAIFGYSSYGPTFGGGHDILINDESNINPGYSYIHSYPLSTYPSGSDESTFLAGDEGNWLTTEIEVYHLYSSGWF